jgi:3-hydroxyisobutyrate dehydrogenase-like beta-hydroxyacid dehydrogenase
MSATVAFVGLGNIGGRVVTHLVAAGHDVAAFDLSTAAVQTAVRAGARSAGSAVQAVEGAEAVFL